MAKPIRKTPTLHGVHADRFISKMIKTQNRKELTPIEKEFIKLMAECK